jgi:divalent metal cation (Fe/Co/Zn/Cd) transporter
VLKFRTAQSPARFQQLGKLGDTDVEMVNVNVDSKSAAAKELLSRNFANGRADIEALLVAVAQDDNPFVKKARKNTVVVKVPTRFAAQLQDAQVEVSKKMTAKEAARIREEFNARVKAAYEAN